MTNDPESSRRDMEEAARQLAAIARSARQGPDQWRTLDQAIATAARAAVAILGDRPRRQTGESGKQRILGYLLARQGDWVSGEELRLAARIGEWGRRVRELRLADGWPTEESSGPYRLVASEPDELTAERWRRLNAIRRREGSARDRIRALLEARVGEAVTRDELDYVARIKEGSRRTREIRDEEARALRGNLTSREVNDVARTVNLRTAGTSIATLSLGYAPAVDRYRQWTEAPVETPDLTRQPLGPDDGVVPDSCLLATTAQARRMCADAGL